MLCSCTTDDTKFIAFVEELEERLEDEESERASLMSRRSSRSRRSHTRAPSSGQGLVSRLMGRNGRASYEPIGDGDE